MGITLRESCIMERELSRKSYDCKSWRSEDEYRRLESSANCLFLVHFAAKGERNPTELERLR